MSYRNKAKDSFKTKFMLFTFHQIINKIESCELDHFRNFKIDDSIIKTYTTNYWQKEKENEIRGITIQEIYTSMIDFKHKFSNQIKALEEDYIKTEFPIIWPESEYQKLMGVSKCHYCLISEHDIEKLVLKNLINKKHLRGHTLEIDRLNSNKEYSKENCVRACYWCNNAKTDEFSEVEFLEIGKAMNIIWQIRLSQ
jgi:5-methylcytosine-specific restriction endonuclease McrA